jgi:hypothetical protein
MYSTKSFCNVSALASNEPGVVSPLGELSTYGYTFSKEIGYFRHSTIDGYELLNLNSETEGVKQAMPQANVDQAVALVDHAVRATLGTSGELYFDEILLQLKQKAEAIGAVALDMGAMVTANGRWVPQWISWSDSNTPDENTHKVWLSLDAFKNQFTDFEIVVVPPFDDLDAFFNPGTIVENRVKAITPTQMMERAELAKDGHPETFFRTDPYEFRDPVVSSRRFDVYWTVIGYGPAGNDPDVIREKLVEFILARSTHTRDEWAAIFPDIFKRTEFIFAPFWNKYAAEQRVFDQGVHSPIIDHNYTAAWLMQQAVGYTEDHILNVAQIMAFPYRSLQIAVAGHIENRDGMVRITDFYPDFINAGTESTDFGRMTPETQEWSQVMLNLVRAAETVDAAASLPRGTYRVNRGDKLYVGKTFNRTLLLVLAKSSAVVQPM